jgi:soluble lytic murein transglycosylase
MFDTIQNTGYKTPMKIRILTLLILFSFLISSCKGLDQIISTSITSQVEIVSPTLVNPEQVPVFDLSPINPSSPIDKAEQALFNGDFSNAITEFQNVFDQSRDPETKAQALLGIGRANSRARNCTSAMDSYNRILGQFATTSVVANAYFFLGQCYSALEEYPQAIDAYEQYLQFRPGILDGTIREMQATAAYSRGDYNRTITFYQAALKTDLPASKKEKLNLKIGQAYASLQNYTTAIQIFQSVYDSSEDAYSKSSANLLMGQAFLKLNMNNEAYTRLMDAVIQFPRPYDSYTSLSILLTHGVLVNDKLRGIVDYYAGDYSDAIQSFERYISNKPLDEDGTVYYYKGLSHFFLDQAGFAIQAYDQLIQNYPSSRFWAAAWDEKAYVQWNLLEEYTNASNTLLTFINQAPKSTEAPGYLFEAGRILERKNDLEGAASLWRRLMDDYPAYERSYHALFLAGIAFYRSGKYDEALSIFQRNSILASLSEEKAAAYLWIGKTYQAKNDPQNAANFWLQAEKAGPTNYYGIRAGELVNNQKPLVVRSVFDLGYDLNYERPEAESWLRTTFKIEPNIDLNGMGELSSEPRMLKAQELWRLDLFDLAIPLFESIQIESETDPTITYRLMNYFYSIGLYRLAINSARNVLDLAGMDDLSSLTAPIFFSHIRFGAYFRPQVVSAVSDEGINPLILYALLRQESLFDTTIVSSAGARGLAQIMPDTGKDINQKLGWPPGYSVEDLNRPVVAVRFAANYLKFLQSYLNDDLFAGVAAYNGGPGNVTVWKGLSQNDPDLLLEIIRLEETQTYLKHIVEFLNVYKLIYSHPQ